MSSKLHIHQNVEEPVSEGEMAEIKTNKNTINLRCHLLHWNPSKCWPESSLEISEVASFIDSAAKRASLLHVANLAVGC